MNTKVDSKHIVNAVLRKIKPQIINNESGRLMFAVFEQAVTDSISADPKAEKMQAKNYLQGDMPHLSMAGVDTTWAFEIMKRYGLIKLWGEQC